MPPAYEDSILRNIIFSKARDLLGWTETDRHEALARSVAWHLANPPEDADADFTADDRALAAV
jgi:hypothetical protein